MPSRPVAAGDATAEPGPGQALGVVIVSQDPGTSASVPLTARSPGTAGFTSPPWTRSRDRRTRSRLTFVANPLPDRRSAHDGYLLDGPGARRRQAGDDRPADR